MNVSASMKEMIYKRKSVRSYTGVPVEPAVLADILSFIQTMTPLYSHIRVRAEIVEKDAVKCIFPWTTPQNIAIFTEEKEGALENVGFLFQQLDLYLQSIGLGTCWLGMGRLAEKEAAGIQPDGLQFTMMLAFGYPDGEAQRKSVSEFKRKALTEISDIADERLEPARLAPSSVNSQPWYFVHEGDIVHAYCVQKGLLKVKMISDMNCIDMGIALAHLYVSHPDTFRFFVAEAPAVKGYGYVGSFSI